jgi:hypothetical protein
LFNNQRKTLFDRRPTEYVLNLTLDKGDFSGYTLLLDKANFERHKAKDYKWWYQDGISERFLNVLIPETFSNSKCICPSNHDKKIRCIYSVYQVMPKGTDYLKVCFYTNTKKRMLKVHTYIVLPVIAEPLCKTLI